MPRMGAGRALLPGQPQQARACAGALTIGSTHDRQHPPTWCWACGGPCSGTDIWLGAKWGTGMAEACGAAGRPLGAGTAAGTSAPTPPAAVHSSGLLPPPRCSQGFWPPCVGPKWPPVCLWRGRGGRGEGRGRAERGRTGRAACGAHLDAMALGGRCSALVKALAVCRRLEWWRRARQPHAHALLKSTADLEVISPCLDIDLPFQLPSALLPLPSQPLCPPCCALQPCSTPSCPCPRRARSSCSSRRAASPGSRCSTSAGIAAAAAAAAATSRVPPVLRRLALP